MNVKGPDSKREEKLNQLIDQYEKDLLRICCVYLKDMTMAEDAVQETFLKAYKNLDSFHGEGSVKSWLIHIAINVCNDMYRSSWHRFVDRRVDLDQLQIPQDERNDVSLSLMMEIMRLPHLYRQLVLLYYYEDFKISEIAKMLNVSESLISRKLKKAREKLKGMLEGVSNHAE